MNRMTQFLAWVRAIGWLVVVILFTEEKRNNEQEVWGQDQ